DRRRREPAPGRAPARRGRAEPPGRAADARRPAAGEPPGAGGDDHAAALLRGPDPERDRGAPGHQPDARVTAHAPVPRPAPRDARALSGARRLGRPDGAGVTPPRWPAARRAG